MLDRQLSVLKHVLDSESSPKIEPEEKIPGDILKKLQPKEIMTLRYWLRGLNYADIGEALQTSERTARNYMTSLHERLNVHTEGELLRAVYGPVSQQELIMIKQTKNLGKVDADILAVALQGMNNIEGAKFLNLSYHSYNDRLKDLYKSFGVDSRTGLFFAVHDAIETHRKQQAQSEPDVLTQS
jgi:DNA-binding CsgD family transcriptional regulator